MTKAAAQGCPLENVAALSAIGSGFAHEIGNPIAGALARLGLASRRTREPETREHLASAHDELTRVAQIIRDLADFTRRDAATAVVDVNEVLRAALTLARYAHHGVRLTVAFEPSPHILPLVGGRHPLLHVLLHLVMHAYETASGDADCLRVRSESRCGEILVIFEGTGGDPPAAALGPCGHVVADDLDATIALDCTADGSRATVRLPIRPVRLQS